MSTLDGLLARATSRETVRTGDAKSGSVFERVVIDGESHFLKRLSTETDWVACWDLWWYIALNRARLPESKEATVDRFRAALSFPGAPR